jgi:hypothetical protein
LEFRDHAAGPLELGEDEPAGSRSPRRAVRPAAKKPPPEEAATPKAEPLDSAVYSFVLSGGFDDIRTFLRASNRFAYPARLEKLRLELAEIASQEDDQPPPVRPNAPPQIHLKFDLKLYFHE